MSDDIGVSSGHMENQREGSENLTHTTLTDSQAGAKTDRSNDTQRRTLGKKSLFPHGVGPGIY